MRRPFAGEPDATAPAFTKMVLLRLTEVGIVAGDDFDVVKLTNGELPDPTENALGPFTKNTTSREAALRNFPHSGNQRWRCMCELWHRGELGATRDEMAHKLRIPDSSADCRLQELRDYGWVDETERTRKTATNSDANVLVLSERGKAHIRDNPHLIDGYTG